MINFEPLWKTLKEKNITTYVLITKYGFSSSTVSRFRNNRPVTTTTINDLCKILSCDISDIMKYEDDDKQDIE